MKTNTLIFLGILILVCGTVATIAMPEGRVIEYRPDYCSGSRYGGGGLSIQVVVENGLDNYIPCDALSIQQVKAMCDSLNKNIKK